MPGGDGTGPDGKGPKSVNKGWPDRYEQRKRENLNRGKGMGKGLRRQDGSCRNNRSSNDR